jgi:hypothetical protein
MLGLKPAYGSGTGSRSYNLADDGTTETAANHMRATTPARPGRLRRIRYSFECLGWRAAMTELANGVDAPESDSEFDAQHGTDTAGSVEPGDLGIGNAESRKLAIRYLPSPLRVTSWMLERIGVDPREYSFVDFRLWQRACAAGRGATTVSQDRGRRDIDRPGRGRQTQHCPVQTVVGAGPRNRRRKHRCSKVHDATRQSVDPHVSPVRPGHQRGSLRTPRRDPGSAAAPGRCRVPDLHPVRVVGRGDVRCVWLATSAAL